MRKNLISVGTLADEGHVVVFSHTYCWILDKSRKVVALGYRDTNNGLYSFKQHISAQTATIDSVSIYSIAVLATSAIRVSITSPIITEWLVYHTYSLLLMFVNTA